MIVWVVPGVFSELVSVEQSAAAFSGTCCSVV